MTREHYTELLRRLDQEIQDMGALVGRTIGECAGALEALDAGRAQALIDADTEIDGKRHDIENQVVVLMATQQPMAGDLRTLVALLTISTELERMGDYCEGIAKLTLRMASEPVRELVREVHTMAEITRQLLAQALQALADRDVDVASQVWRRDDEIDELYQQVFRAMLLEMVTDKTSIRAGTYMLWVAHNFERMADRVTNIAERVAFMVTGDVAGFRDHIRAQSVPGP